MMLYNLDYQGDASEVPNTQARDHRHLLTAMPPLPKGKEVQRYLLKRLNDETMNDYRVNPEARRLTYTHRLASA